MVRSLRNPNDNSVSGEKANKDEQGEDEEENTNSVVIDVRPARPKNRKGDCINGKRKICVKKYETECRTDHIEHEMVEDHPRCRVQMVERCPEGEDISFLQKGEAGTAQYIRILLI